MTTTTYKIPEEAKYKNEGCKPTKEDIPKYLISKHLLEVIRGYCHNQKLASFERVKLCEQFEHYELANSHAYSADVAKQIISEIDRILTSDIIDLDLTKGDSHHGQNG